MSSRIGHAPDAGRARTATDRGGSALGPHERRGRAGSAAEGGVVGHGRAEGRDAVTQLYCADGCALTRIFGGIFQIHHGIIPKQLKEPVLAG